MEMQRAAKHNELNDEDFDHLLSKSDLVLCLRNQPNCILQLQPKRESQSEFSLCSMALPRVRQCVGAGLVPKVQPGILISQVPLITDVTTKARLCVISHNANTFLHQNINLFIMI